MEQEYQLTLDDIEVLRTPNALTTRQWRLHDLLLSVGKHRLTHKQMLMVLDDWYGYTIERAKKPDTPFNDLTCNRELTEDIDIITRNETIQHVYVGGGYAMSKDEAWKYILNKRISALKELKKTWVQQTKLALDGQQRLVFNHEKNNWESILKIYEAELAELAEKEK